MRNASAVFCNSLHGACLSPVLHKEFYAFHRGVGGKCRDVCRKFVLEERYADPRRFVAAVPIDWARADSLREWYRAEALEWIDRAMIRDFARMAGATGKSGRLPPTRWRIMT